MHVFHTLSLILSSLAYFLALLLKREGVPKSQFELGHDTVPALMHHLGTNKTGRSYTLYELGPNLALALKMQRMLREVSKEDESLKIPMTSDEPTRCPNNCSNDCARSPSLLGLVMGVSPAVMKIFLMTQDSIDLE